MSGSVGTAPAADVAQARPRARWVDISGPADDALLALSPVLPEVTAATAAASGKPVVLLRRQLPYVLLGPRDRRLPDMAAGVRGLALEGFPVYMRIGGGSAVLLDEGSLSFGVARPCRDLTWTDRNFRELGEGVRRGLRRLGVETAFGAAAGSYCEGPFDLVVGRPPRKIAGVAQALRGGFTLVSGMVLVDQDPQAATARLQGFYRAAGDQRRLDAGAVTSLSEVLGRPVALDEVAAALRAGFAEQFELDAEPLSPAEMARARALGRLRRLA